MAITQKKGGVGKTTTAVSVAAIAAERGLRVVLIDLDSQASATTALGHDSSDAAADVLLGNLPLEDAWVKTPAGVLLVPSGPGTEGAERLLAGDAIAGLVALRTAIRSADLSAIDAILIDTRPDEAHAVLNAYVAATVVWIVAEPVPASVEVIARLLNTVERVRAGLNPALTVEAIIPTRFDARTRVHAGGVTALRQAFGDVVTQPIPLSVKVAESHGARVPLPLYAPTSPSAVAYRQIAKRLLPGAA